MKSAFFLFTLLFFLPFNLQAQEVAPIQLGNVWIYENDASLLRIEVVDTAVIIDSIQYFKVDLNYQNQESRLIRLRADDFYVIKEDSAFPEPFNEKKYYKKNAQPGETWEVVIPGLHLPVVYTILGVVPTNIFDTTVTGKILKEDFDFTYWNYIWTEEFGKLSKKNMQGVIEYLLRACVINGIVYGDTNFTALSVNTSEPVFNYKLFNNYPNPFNPKTSIQYAVGSWQFVILKVYDVLGNEVATLVNKEKPPGVFEVEWNASEFPSGIYFYQLRVYPAGGGAGNFIETKKMVLIK